MAQGQWVFDQLLCFLGEPYFQAPVNTFMDSNCLIFDPTEDLPEYKTIHQGYKALVSVILEGFREDSGLSHDQIIKALADMNKKPDLREIFRSVFEQVLATESYALFCRLMRHRNIELQQQAMMLIMKQYGQLPESLKPTKKAEAASKGAAGDKTGPPKENNSEHQVLEAVMSQPEPEVKKSTDESKKMVAVVQKEAEALEDIRQKETVAVQKAMNEMVIESPAKSSPPPAAVPAKAANVPAKIPAPKVAVSSAKDVSGADAANSWLKSAMAETKDATPALQKAVEAFQQLSPEELQKRQNFLQEQRSKLVAMKQKEREKQLNTHDQSKSGLSRPKSARVARSAMTGGVQDSSAEDDKKLAMRKAIAARLKNEVVAITEEGR